MALQVLGAGFGRTGTFSLKRALDMLGFDTCHHMYEVRQSRQQVEWWHAAALGAEMDWDEVFEGYKSQVDWPGSFFWRDLSAHFPQAKVILTDRDPESWYNSICQTILPASERGRIEDPDPTNRLASEMMYHIALEGVFEGRLRDKEFAISRFLAHKKKVVDTIQVDRLLIFQVGDGWDPLCKFLGVPIPDQSYPSGNSIAEFRARKPYLIDAPLNG